MAEATDETAEGIRRALDAAEAANEAAQDIANLSAAHREFAEAVMRGQRRNSLFAAGAAAGAAVALALGGLVYFRSVSDLRIAAAVQSEAAKLLVEELTQMDGIGDAVAEQQARMRDDTLALLEKVKDEIRRAAAGDVPEEDPMSAQIATEIREGVKADLEGIRDEILAALAEMQVSGAAGNTAELTGAVAELKALVERTRTIDSPAPKPAPATAPASARPQKPKPKSAPEPDPFAYP